MKDAKMVDGALICERDGKPVSDHEFYKCCQFRTCGPHATLADGVPCRGEFNPDFQKIERKCGTCGSVLR